MIKAAFFDIDGTLLSFDTHRVSDGTVRAFDKLHQQGIQTFISTGRPKMLIPEMPVEFAGYVTMNGGYVYEGDEILLRNPIPQSETDRWISIAKQEGMSTLLFGEHQMYGANRNSIIDQVRQQLEFEMPEFVDIDQLFGFETYQIIAVMPPERDREIEAMLPSCRIPRWHPKFSDVVFHANSKATGIESVLRHHGYTRDESICFGDGGNDIEMLDYCGIGVAMGNASDEVKRHADYVTTSVDEEGIEQALTKLHII